MPVALGLLVVRKKLRLAVYVVLVVVLGPVLLRTIASVQDDHTRLWLAIPAAILAPIYILMGFWTCLSAWNVLRGTTSPGLESRLLDKTPGSPWLSPRRVKGLLLMAFGGAAWVFGLLYPNLSKWQEIAVMALAFYPLVLGFFWFTLDRTLNEPASRTPSAT